MYYFLNKININLYLLKTDNKFCKGSKMNFQNPMTFQIFLDQYKPWLLAILPDTFSITKTWLHLRYGSSTTATWWKPRSWSKNPSSLWRCWPSTKQSPSSWSSASGWASFSTSLIIFQPQFLVLINICMVTPNLYTWIQTWSTIPDKSLMFITDYMK